jgi:hypothetical protein
VISTPAEERFLDDALLEALLTAGNPGHIRFEDADYVLLIETLGGCCGIALFSREDRQRYPFLGI